MAGPDLLGWFGLARPANPAHFRIQRPPVGQNGFLTPDDPSVNRIGKTRVQGNQRSTHHVRFWKINDAVSVRVPILTMHHMDIFIVEMNGYVVIEGQDRQCPFGPGFIRKKQENRDSPSVLVITRGNTIGLTDFQSLTINRSSSDRATDVQRVSF
jgi:hypothetical protein